MNTIGTVTDEKQGISWDDWQERNLLQEMHGVALRATLTKCDSIAVLLLALVFWGYAADYQAVLGFVCVRRRRPGGIPGGRRAPVRMGDPLCRHGRAVQSSLSSVCTHGALGFHLCDRQHHGVRGFIVPAEAASDTFGCGVLNQQSSHERRRLCKTR